VRERQRVHCEPVLPVSDPISRLVLSIAVMLAAAKVGGDIAARLKQPSVLGELLAGILLGAIPSAFLSGIRDDPTIDVLARIGSLVLLFEVGLESTVRDVLRVGAASARVAVLGSAGTMAVGWLAARLVLPGRATLVHLFLAAALTATSIGISARVLKDVGASRGREAHTILGAAIFDDILGLVILAAIGGAATHAEGAAAAGFARVAWLALKASAFLAIAILAGATGSPALFRATARLRTGGALVATGLCLCFVLAWAADVIGLAPIVGAFAAGLVLEESHSAPFVARGERSLADRVEPISSWLVPIFFVLMGMRADFGAMTRGATLLLVAALAAAAVVGKLACALGSPRGTDHLAVAFGMIPRGEVSLVFANLGLVMRVDGHALLDSGQYSALVTVVILTTLATPPALRWRLGRSARA
jgi:Kef-type K+ transport system membrane component KefB